MFINNISTGTNFGMAILGGSPACDLIYAVRNSRNDDEAKAVMDTFQKAADVFNTGHDDVILASDNNDYGRLETYSKKDPEKRFAVHGVGTKLTDNANNSTLNMLNKIASMSKDDFRKIESDLVSERDKYDEKVGKILALSEYKHGSIRP